ncbi:MAG TPA: hypothetical protein VM097_08055 [Mycobacteriales bacterium]|nr:hypothetical protein [Mycobacteriales bacterium]
MTRRPLLALTAATAALALGAAGSASAATATTAVGRGTSSLTVLNLSVAGHELSLADLLLTSDTIASPRVSSVSFTPVTVDGTSYGRQTVNQSSSPQSVAAVNAPAALAPVASLTSPAVGISATDAPSNHAGAGSLGTVTVLGLPVRLAGALDAASAVSTTTGAKGSKTVSISDLALPSIADVLAALGLDLSKLPVGTLDELVNALELVTGAITTAENTVDTAQAAVTAATSDLATKTAALGTAQTALTAAAASLTSVINSNLLALVPFSVTDIVTLLGLNPTQLGLAEAAVPALTAALATYTSAEAVVATAQTAVNNAQALLATVTSTLTNALNNLVALLKARLDATPLVSLDSLAITTRAAVSSASKGGQHAEVVGGTVKGLRVLGVDVLASALGSSTLDLEGVAAPALAQVNGLIADVTGTLSDVLSTVPGFPKLEVPAPVIGLLTKSTATSISGGFGKASTVVRALSITVPGITLPTALALPGAAGLPAFDSVNQIAGQLTSAPLSLSVLTLRDQAAFRPAVVGGSQSGVPGTDGELADTGLPAGAAGLSLLLVGCALMVRRRMVTAA